MAGAGTKAKVRYGSRSTSAAACPAAGRRRASRVRAARRRLAQVARPATAADGSYRFTLRPSRSGAFRAVADGAIASAAGGHRRGAASPDVPAGTSGRGARARARQARPGLGGPQRRLQVRTRGGWSTVDRDPHGPRRPLPRRVASRGARALPAAREVRRRPPRPPRSAASSRR